MRNDQTQRVAVLPSQGLSVVVSGEQNFRAVEIGQRHIGGESLFGVDQHICRFRLGTNASQQFLEGHAVPAVVEAAPSSYTMEIAGSLDFGQSVELFPTQPERRINQSGYAKVPGLRVKPRHRTIVQHRPLERERLAGRQKALALLQLLEFFTIAALE